MKLAVLSAIFAAGAYGAQTAKHPNNPSPNGVEFKPPGPYNCACHCDCEVTVDKPCNVDYMVVLDAASCVRNAWAEMKNRVRQLAQEVDDSGRALGEQSRFSVIRYALEAKVDISLNENLSFQNFSKRLSGLKTWNQASYLSKGWEILNEQISMWERSGRKGKAKLVVIVITNAISHPNLAASPQRSEVRATDEKIRQLNGGKTGLFINTIIKPQESKFARAGMDCDACDWNYNLFFQDQECSELVNGVPKDEARCPALMNENRNDPNRVSDQKFFKKCCKFGTGKGLEFNGQVEFNDQVFYKSSLMDEEDGLLKQLETDNFCPKTNTDVEECNNCMCDCDIPVPEEGQPGPPGPPGVPGIPSRPGQPGQPGKDGACGVDGPDGGNGCDGACGNPGHHGEPGQPGQPGNDGRTGAPGCQGKQGPKATSHRYAAGPDGPQGPNGQPGDSGSDGMPGQNGRPGKPGMNGPEGKPGPAGKAGRPGQPGNNGGRGQPGQSGEDGPDGANGSQGETGNKGPQGEQGAAGQPGGCGKQGRNGAPGLCGRTGRKGVPGMQGPCGAPGQMGAGVSEREIRAKVDRVLDRLLPKNNGAARNDFFCKCQAYNLFDAVIERFNF